MYINEPHPHTLQMHSKIYVLYIQTFLYPCSNLRCTDTVITLYTNCKVVKSHFHLLFLQSPACYSRLRTEHCQLLSHLHRLKISHTSQWPCAPPPPPHPFSCPPPKKKDNPILRSCLILMLWDAVYGPSLWKPTTSSGIQHRCCSRLQTLSSSPYWKSNMAGNEGEEKSFAQTPGIYFFISQERTML